MPQFNGNKFANNYSYFYKELPDRITRNEPAQKKWIDENEPETTPFPDYEDKINADQKIVIFMH